MIMVENLEIEGKFYQGLKVEFKQLPPLVLIEGNKGFIMCGYLNIDAAESLGATAAVVSGVNNWEDVVNAEIKVATLKARALGLEPGKIVRDVIRAIA
jgi:uncharacterized protein YunC (DUF1805 family)